MSFKQRFSDQDLQRIKDAVKDAEDKISGEIVPVIVERSGFYSLANYRSAMIFAALAFISLILLDRYVIADASHTLYYDPFFIFVMVVASGLVGAYVPSVFPAYKRMLLTKHQLDYATRQRAENAFLEEEVFNTRQRTGIMIFISFFEHEVIVMADKGISEVVEQKQWDYIVGELIKHIRAGHIVEGLEKSIKSCGELLLQKGFAKTADDVNELTDDLRIE